MNRLFAIFLSFLSTITLVLPAAERTILFVDDHEVLYRAGTRRVLHPPTRHAQNPLIREEKPWELAIGWTSVARNPQTGKYQLWYQAFAGDRARAKTHECVVCYAESEDGVEFVKPDLGLFEFNDEKRTNIVLIGSGLYGHRYCNAVVVDPRDTDAARRYKMAFTDWSQDAAGGVWLGMHVAFSPDGVHWTQYADNPRYRVYHGIKKVPPPFRGENPNQRHEAADGRVRHQARLPMTLSDAVDVFFDPRHKRFVIYGKMWIGGPEGGLGWKHGMGRSESPDFLNWSKPTLVCAPDDADGRREFHTSPVFLHRDRYFCLNQILDRAGGGVIDVELMISRDGLEWERPFRQPFFIPRDPGQRFDSGSILTNANLIIHGDEMRMYYGAYGGGAVGGGTNITGDQQQSGVGLVTLPLDRFAGIRSEPEAPTAKIPHPPEIGQITLKPLDLAGHNSIRLNANASRGAIRVELLDEDGYRVPGFDKDQAVPLQTDSLRHLVTWKTGTLDTLPAGRYHLRLHLEQAEVFALSLE